MKINRANFLTWYNSTSYEQLPIYSDPCTHGIVGWAVGENMTFIVNTAIGIPLSGGWATSLCDLNKNVISSLGNLTTFTGETSVGGYGYGSFNCPSVSEGLYILKSVGGSTTIYSSPIYVLGTETKTKTARFKFRHKFSKNGVEYTHSILGSFYQKFRLFCNFNSLEFQSQKDIFQDNDSALPREYNHKVDYLYKINLLNLSLDEHQAAHDMATCSELYINDLPMQVSGSYSAERIRKNGTSNGSFSVSDYNLRYSKRV